MKIIITFFCIFTISSSIGQTVIPFDSPIPSAPTICNDSWTETSIPQQIIPIPPSTTCSFDYSLGVLWLYPARLNLDLSSLSNISSIEIDLIDFCAIGCTIIEFFENGNSVGTAANATTSSNETVIYTNSGMDLIDEMTIDGLESQLFEIRIFTDTTCDDPIDAEVWVQDGDVYVEDACNGIILTSPNGNCYRVRVDDNGTLITTTIICP